MTLSKNALLTRRLAELIRQAVEEQGGEVDRVTPDGETPAVLGVEYRDQQFSVTVGVTP